MSVTSTNTSGKPPSALNQATNALSQVFVFTRQPAFQRALPAVLITVILVLGFLAWSFLGEPARKTLYPGMAEAEKAMVVETLTAAGIDAVIDSSTGEVAVASNDFYKARMTLASAGLPSNVPAGSDVLSELQMGTSRSVEAARLRQAQEIDLARSITEIASVAAARVHLALPERSAFLRDTQPPRASVFVQLAQGRSLDSGQIEAIVNLVSSSVSGMARQDVTIVDQMGRLLSRGSDDAGMVLNDRELEHRVTVERLYRNRIEALVAPIVGPDNLSVQVTVDMDFTRSETIQELVDPAQVAVLSEAEQLSESSAQGARGIPGAITNTPPPDPVLQDGTATTTTTETASGNRSSSTTKNYEVSRTRVNTQAPTAQVTKISAAILVRAPQEGADTTALTDTLKELAQTAIGFDDSRGDSVTVMAQPFVAAEIAAPSAISSWTWLPDVIRQVAIVLVLGVIALGVVRPILDRVLVPVSQTLQSDPGFKHATIEVGEGESLSDLQKRLNTRRGELTRSAMGSNVPRDEKFAVIRQMAEEDPARIANILHRMMAEELDQVT
ncbi:flagellar basal-body MS-ring/collar protein FliF [Marivivens sp. LCG002]|uniref:flagellar basal-body MS-ring/collar protein FliF n=1 Tax=Marivivens sp. LCG002 TaxID=3051171 RepID=UPI00255375B9|nr:flagellar basal-body MS-ring/collar protein FliF [Marivivens sp. LCG002]WIV51292.1 flagellar basal-body MS-ring/collar protein FliF [Marivivens sp. LCG002]